MSIISQIRCLQLLMKAIQKQYTKQIKVSTNKDTFTTYQRRSHQQRSPILQEKQKLDIQHHQIESLKCTLKSMSQQVSMDLSKMSSKGADVSINDQNSHQTEHKIYNIKLEQLTKNLQEISAKGYFSPANSANQRPRSSTYNYNQTNRIQLQNFDKSQKISTYEQLRTQHPKNNTNFQHFGASKSQSFIKKDDSHSNSKNNSQNKSIHHMEHNKANHQGPLWSGKSDLNSKKTFSKKDIITQHMTYMQNQNSKNLTKIFQQFDDTTRIRERADTQFKQNPIMFYKPIHRAKITSILIADQIYTSSLDYTIRKTTEKDGDFSSEVVDKFRGCVEYTGLINGKVFGVGRDSYLRSIDGNFHYKFSSCPLKFYESERNNQISMGFISNEISLFDLQKRVGVSSMLVSKGYQMMSKWNKELYIGDNMGLAAIDWRKKQHFIPIYQSPSVSNKNWMSLPFERHFAYHSNGQIIVLGQKINKNYSQKLSINESFKCYDWNRAGLHVVTTIKEMTTAKLTKIKNDGVREQVDIEVNGQNISLMVVREKQIIYGGTTGELIIKKIKK